MINPQKIALSLSLLIIAASSTLYANPSFPEDGYETYEVPLFWQDMGKKGAPSKLFEFEKGSTAPKELERDEVYFIDLPEAPKSGKLYVKITMTGKTAEELSNAPVIQIYGATLSYALLPTEDATLGLQKMTYAFDETAENAEGSWVGYMERRLPKKRSDADEKNWQRAMDRFLSTQRFSIEIDFDQQTWKPLSRATGSSYPLLKEKGKKNILIRKQKGDEAYVSSIVFAETRYSRVNGPKRPSGMSKEDWEKQLAEEMKNRMSNTADTIRKRREEREAAKQKADTPQ